MVRLPLWQRYGYAQLQATCNRRNRNCKTFVTRSTFPTACLLPAVPGDEVYASSVGASVATLCNAAVGAGVLSLPFAFREAGAVPPIVIVTHFLYAAVHRVL